MRLFRFEARWLDMILRAMLPEGDEGSIPVGDRRSVQAFAHSFSRRAPIDATFGVRFAIWLITFAPILWRFRLRPFGRLASNEQVAFLDAMAASDTYLVREIPTLIKMIGCFALFSEPETHARLGSRHAASGAGPDWLTPASANEGARR